MGFHVGFSGMKPTIGDGNYPCHTWKLVNGKAVETNQVVRDELVLLIWNPRIQDAIFKKEFISRKAKSRDNKNLI